MLGLGVRSGVKRVARRALTRLETWLDDEPEPQIVVPEVPVPPPVAAAPPVAAEAPQAAPPPEAPQVEPPIEAAPIEAAPGLDHDAVEAVIEDLIRPALNADGGDIVLVKVEGVDVYVRLIGACSTCPSSTVTMKMGIERLLQEEFPQIGQIIQVEETF